MAEVRPIGAAEAAGMLAERDALLIDVREPDEFRGQHIALAISMPLATVAAALGTLGLRPDRPLIFQCQKGKRGEQACAVVPVTHRGPIYNLTGGIEGWAAAGLPVVGAGEAARGLPLMRQVQIVVGLLVTISALLGIAGFAAGVWLAALLGAALAMAGTTGWCGMALLLARMPWNQPQ